MHYVDESSHKDRSTRMVWVCACVFVCVPEAACGFEGMLAP